MRTPEQLDSAITRTMGSKITDATIEIADNGYILRIDNGSIVVVCAYHIWTNEKVDNNETIS